MKNFDFSVIKSLRQKVDMTAGRLAEKARIARLTVAKIECGKGNPTVETVAALSEVFGMTPSELIRLAEKKNIEEAILRPFPVEGVSGTSLCFPDISLHHCFAKLGTEIHAGPKAHDSNTEICLVLKGKLRMHIGETVKEISGGAAMRFNAWLEHWLEIVENTEFVMIQLNRP
jgi:transcriptional regulator with XRE-family HTH domain